MFVDHIENNTWARLDIEFFCEPVTASKDKKK